MANNTPFATKHQFLIGKSATEKQLRLYEKFPEFRGISKREKDEEILEAVLFLALNFGQLSDKVIVFAPPSYETWVIEQFNKLSEVIFNNCKTIPAEKRLVIAQHYGKMFRKILFYGYLLRVEEEPSYWVSFGFSKDDVVPDWVSSRLL